MTVKPLKILIGCEFSGRVRQAFRSIGHDAWSCDLIESEDKSEYHIKCNVLSLLDDGWDLAVFHPPCTYLTRAGARWWKGWHNEQSEALDFVMNLMNAPINKIAIENPPGAIGTQIRKADQYIQPWQFGHPENKMTGLWLKNLPALRPTIIVKTIMDELPKKEKNRVHYMRPGPNRWKDRSRTYQGIADAMAFQWGNA